jgi:hypothetical protein
MRALTVRLPWSWAITHGQKDVENRTWPAPSWLDTFAIHAGALSGWDTDGEFSPTLRRAWEKWAATLPAGNVAAVPIRRAALHIDHSAIVAVVRLADCHDATGAKTCSCSPWSAPRSWHWQLADVRPLRSPVPCKGMLGLWNLPGDVESAVMAQIMAQIGERTDA